tara:strand:- start:51848 stop:53710 length:1863 start_codon:yes stop_codon:yes gene_type:complete
VKTGKELLSETDWRIQQIRQIKRLYSVTEEVWIEHYFSVIERFAELVQGVAASELHHHSRPGGLLDHSLECLLAGSQVAQGYVLPPNSEPEKIAANSDRWRFGVFVAVLAHDLGKIVTDIEVVYRIRGGDFVPWHPWYGAMPVGAEYDFRFRARAENAGVAKSLHEKASVSLLPGLLTKPAVKWIFDDAELLAQLLSTINHAPFGGGALSEIVRLADRASVGQDLGAETGVATGHSSSTPLHEKIILTLKKLITDGDLKQNRPGSAIWITDKHTWGVSKKVAEAVRDQLVSEGHKGIPQSPLRIFSILQDHSLIVLNPTNDPIWKAEVRDPVRSWNQKLTFLRFDNSLLWSTGNPKVFDGEVVPVDGKGNPLEEIEADATHDEQAQVEEVPPVPVVQEPKVVADDLAVGSAVQEKIIAAEAGVGGSQPACEKPRPAESVTGESQAAPVNESDSDPVVVGVSVNSEKGDDAAPRKKSGKAGPVMFQMPGPKKDAAAESEFLAWIVEAVERRKVRVNEPKALVHIVGDHVFLVSPNIFIRYLQDHPMRKKAYETKAQGSKAYKLLQREFQSLDVNKCVNGENIIKAGITGAKNQSHLNGYLVHKRHLPFFKKFPSNKAVSLP